MRKTTCTLVSCHGKQTEGVSSILSFLKFLSSFLIASEILGFWGKLLRK